MRDVDSEEPVATARVLAGICGLTSVIEARTVDGQEVTLAISTECPSYAPLQGTAHRIDAFEACFGQVGQGPVYQLFRLHCAHAACPVPSAATKAIEITARLALPADVHIEATR